MLSSYSVCLLFLTHLVSHICTDEEKSAFLTTCNKVDSKGLRVSVSAVMKMNDVYHRV